MHLYWIVQVEDLETVINGWRSRDLVVKRWDLGAACSSVITADILRGIRMGLVAMSRCTFLLSVSLQYGNDLVSLLSDYRIRDM